MKIFFLENLSSEIALPCNPWEFQQTAEISEEVRTVKEKRRKFYKDPSTRHCFYSGIEPTNPNIRISKDNPPFKIWYLVADYDNMMLSALVIEEAIKKMPFKPFKVEQSLGRNWRLIFKFAGGIPTGGNYDLTSFLLRKMITWLRLAHIPCLDEKDLTTPTTYYCNGCKWIDSPGFGEVPREDVQAFLVKAAAEFNFKPVKGQEGDLNIPLDVIEKALRDKYPSFNWPGPFVDGSSGPTFWVPESTSPNSAIVHKGGIYSFADHAPQAWNSWSSLLGAEFSNKWNNTAMAKATDDIHYDDHDFFIKGPSGLYRRNGLESVRIYLKCECGLSGKPDKQTGKSQIDEALAYIMHRQDRISGAAPFCFQRPGIIFHNGEKKLNTYARKPIPMAAGKQELGPHGNFPLISAWLLHMFKNKNNDANNEDFQFWHSTAWLQRLLHAAHEWKPSQGHVMFLVGVNNAGKTVYNRDVCGAAVGGFVDATDVILKNTQFTAYAYEAGYWAIDDDNVGTSPDSIRRASTMYKKVVANADMLSQAKFQKQVIITFCGRIGTTLNDDSNSLRIIGPQDNATLEKTNIYRCNPIRFAFSTDFLERVRHELPFFLRWVYDVHCPDFILPYGRFGFCSYQEPTLLDQTNQAQPIAPFKELLIDLCARYRKNFPAEKMWRGTLTQLLAQMSEIPATDYVMRKMSPEQINRYLEQIQKEGVIKIYPTSGRSQVRIWEIPLDQFDWEAKNLPEPQHQVETEKDKPNPFAKNEPTGPIPSGETDQGTRT